MTDGLEGHKIPGITAVILAGGRNTRYPIPKGLIKIGGVPIVERNLSLLRQIFGKVFISANLPELYFHLGARLLGDIMPSCGPISGIHTALLNSGTDDVFVSACDMPFPSPELARLVCERHLGRAKEGCFAATAPVFDGKAQPLFAVYSRTVINCLEDAIISKRVSMTRFLEEIGTLYIHEAEIRQADPAGRSFLNINTPEDFDAITGQMSVTMDSAGDGSSSQ